MTDRMFNELLQTEASSLMAFYQRDTHYEAHPYYKVAIEFQEDAVLSEEHWINPGDSKDVAAFLRKQGSRYAYDRPQSNSLAVFVAEPSLAFPTDPTHPVPRKVMVIYGCTNDGRSNMAILEAQHDEDDRLYLGLLEIHYSDPVVKTFQMNSVEPFLEFFSGFNSVKEKMAVSE